MLTLDFKNLSMFDAFFSFFIFNFEFLRLASL